MPPRQYDAKSTSNTIDVHDTIESPLFVPLSMHPHPLPPSPTLHDKYPPTTTTHDARSTPSHSKLCVGGQDVLGGGTSHGAGTGMFDIIA
jgi:hypothetical protein